MISLKIMITAAWLVHLTPSSFDTETPVEREVRMLSQAQGMDRAVKRLMCTHEHAKDKTCVVRWFRSYSELIVAMGTQGYHETKFDRELQAGHCKSYQCDPIWLRDKKTGARTKVFQARGAFQVQRQTEVARYYWDKMVGLSQERVNNAAWVIGRIYSMNQCRGNKTHMFQSVAGRGCSTGELGKKRAWWYRRQLNYYRVLAYRMTQAAKAPWHDRHDRQDHLLSDRRHPSARSEPHWCGTPMALGDAVHRREQNG